MKKPCANSIISLLLALECALLPCAVQWSFALSPTVSGHFLTEQYERHDILCAREEQGTVLLLARRAARQQHKLLAGAGNTLFFAERALFFCRISFALHSCAVVIQNKYVRIIQYLQTLF